MTYDVETALSDNTFTKIGYTFQGWATSADGEVAYKDKQAVKNLAASENVTLVAVWKKSYSKPSDFGN